MELTTAALVECSGRCASATPDNPCKCKCNGAHHGSTATDNDLTDPQPQPRKKDTP